MILLDTNVVSELRRRRSGAIDPAVRAWDDSLGDERTFLSVITILELRRGVLLKARCDWDQAVVLSRWLEGQVLPLFADRILAVDTRVALVCAQLHVPTMRPHHDALIAATAIVHELALATRNTRDFAGTGVRLTDPWSYRVGAGSAPA